MLVRLQGSTSPSTRRRIARMQGFVLSAAQKTSRVVSTISSQCSSRNDRPSCSSSSKGYRKDQSRRTSRRSTRLRAGSTCSMSQLASMKRWRRPQGSEQQHCVSDTRDSASVLPPTLPSPLTPIAVPTCAQAPLTSSTRKTSCALLATTNGCPLKTCGPQATTPHSSQRSLTRSCTRIRRKALATFPASTRVPLRQSRGSGEQRAMPGPRPILRPRSKHRARGHRRQSTRPGRCCTAMIATLTLFQFHAPPPTRRR